MSTTRKRRRREGVDEPEVVGQILEQMLLVQNLTGCATTTCDMFLKHLQPFLKGCEHVKVLKMRRIRSKQSPIKRQMHGCVDCNDYVFGPENMDTHCHKCGHARYDAKGKPHEVSAC